MTRGRPRKHHPTIPEHIDQSRLPKGLYWDKSGAGRWYTREMVDGRRTAVRVAGPGAKLSELHAIMEERAGIDRTTVDWLLGQFHGSGDFKALAPTTQRDYTKYRRYISELPTRVGKPLGALAVARLSLPFMQRIFDATAERTPTLSNHLLRYLRRSFRWGMVRGHCTHNPCAGAQQARERRQRVVPTLEQLARVTAFAQERGALPARTPGSVAPYLWVVIELAYLCLLRPIEVITLTDANAVDDGVLTNRRKGSTDVVMAWTPRLRAAWDAALALRADAVTRTAHPIPLRADERTLIVSSHCMPLRRSSLDSAWQRMMRQAVDAGVLANDERFGMHAMKHRGITDTPGTRHDKRQASGHKSESMMDTYDHAVPLITPQKPK